MTIVFLPGFDVLNSHEGRKRGRVQVTISDVIAQLKVCELCQNCFHSGLLTLK